MRLPSDSTCLAFGMTVAAILKRHHVSRAAYRAMCGVGSAHVNALLKERHS